MSFQISQVRSSVIHVDCYYLLRNQNSPQSLHTSEEISSEIFLDQQKILSASHILENSGIKKIIIIYILL